MKRYRTKHAERNILTTYDRLLDEWKVEINQLDVQTQYGSTHVNVFGKMDAAPVLLFHGVADDSALMWIYNASGLAQHFRLYAVDTIGGPGKSLPSKDYRNSFDVALWIDELLDRLCLDNVYMAGVSHGGYIVQYYTLMRNHRVKKAISMASSVPAEHSGNTMVQMLKIFLPEALLPTKRNIEQLLTKLTGENSAAFIENSLIVDHFTHLLRGYNNMCMRSHKIIKFSDEQIDIIRPKLLYLLGEKDPFARMGGQAMLERYGMRARYYPEAGHGINHEIADAINAELITYFCD